MLQDSEAICNSSHRLARPRDLQLNSVKVLRRPIDGRAVVRMMAGGGNSEGRRAGVDHSPRKPAAAVLIRNDEVKHSMSSHSDDSCTAPERFTIALDGLAAAGKSTVAALVADLLGAVVFDTGILYRAVTLGCIEDDIDSNDEASLARLAGDIDVDVRPPSVDDGRKLDVLFRGRDVTGE